jgi:4-amino-4-deoxy-L-arabinose transferase-like glycosyltransferase
VADLIKIQRGTWTKGKIFFLFVIPLFLYIAPLPVMSLIEPDEARYSDIPSLMNRTGDYITPRLNHVVYLEKPPLCYWATALFFRIFGENEFSSRLFTALCAWGCIFLVYRIGAFFHDEKTGLYSAGVLSTFAYHFILGKINILDMPLTFFVCLAMWAGYRFCSEDCRKKGWLYLFYVSSALAFLTKGLIGIIFPFAITILWLLVSKRWREVLKLFSPVGMILFLLISCPWIILVQRANKDFLWFFFIHEHFLRYSTPIHSRHQDLLFYALVVVFGTIPWSAFLLKALKEGKDKKTPLFKPTERHFLLIWIFFIYIFFYASSSKLASYIAPIFLPIAIFYGRLFVLYEDREIDSGKGRGKRFLYDLPIILQSLFFITALLLTSSMKTLNLGKWGNLHIQNAWGLIGLPILFQVTILFLPTLVMHKWRRGWFLTTSILSALFLVSLYFPAARLLTQDRSAYPVSKAVRALLPPGQELLQYRLPLYGIDFYNKIRTPIVGRNFGELEFGLNQLPADERSHYYLSYEGFRQYYEEKGDVYCVTRCRYLEELKEQFPIVEVLWKNKEFCLLRLRRSS